MIDAHFHCWQLSRGDYRWLDPALNPALHPICRNVTVPDWQLQSRPLGVSGGILVQAAPTEDETLFLLEQADRNPAVLGVVGWVDLLAPQAPQRVRVLAQHPMLKGLRPMLHDLPDPAWILQPAVQPALQAMADEKLVFDALVKPVHLPHILAMAQRHPGLQIVIDHAAKPPVASQLWQPWANDLAAIARQTSAVCKLSGLLTEAGDLRLASDATNAATGPSNGLATGQQAGLSNTQNAGLAAVAPYVAHVMAVFGPERLLWGSDWPVLELSGLAFADWLQISRVLLQNLDAKQRMAVFADTARRIYRL